MLPAQPPQRHYTVEDYFCIEASADMRHEFYQGAIFAMAGASRNHNRIAGNVFAALRAALRNTPCEAFALDMRLWTPSGLYTYPDVMVICGPIHLTNDRLETVTNPTVLVEVLSDSTRDYDQHEKFTLYGSIPTFREYVLIEQASVQIEHWVLSAGNTWTSRHYESLQESLSLTTMACQIPLTEIYARVEFPTGTP
jgi:Uma2 family endonuclease